MSQLHVIWDDGGALSVLAALQDQKLALQAANAAARVYAEEVRRYLGESHGFLARRDGPLYRSIRVDFLKDGAEVRVGARHGIFLEEGTDAHKIVSRKFVRQKPNGDRVYITGKSHRRKSSVYWRARLKIPRQGGGFAFPLSVNHPGTRATPFFFADFAAREAKMQDAVRGVLAAKLEGAR